MDKKIEVKHDPRPVDTGTVVDANQRPVDVRVLPADSKVEADRVKKLEDEIAALKQENERILKARHDEIDRLGARVTADEAEVNKLSELTPEEVEMARAKRQAVEAQLKPKFGPAAPLPDKKFPDVSEDRPWPVRPEGMTPPKA